MDETGLISKTTGLNCLTGLLKALIISSTAALEGLLAACSACADNVFEDETLVILHVTLMRRFLMRATSVGKSNRWEGKNAITRGWCIECDPCNTVQLTHLVVDTRSFASSLAASLHGYEHSEPMMQTAKLKHFNT